MTDKDWILLAIGCLIGLVTSFGAFYLLVLVEDWVEGWLDARKRITSRSSTEPMRDVPTPPPKERRVLYGYVSLVVFILSSFLGGIAGRTLLRRLDASKRIPSRSSTEPTRDVPTPPPKERRGLYGFVVVAVFILSSFFGAIAARNLLGW